MAISLKRGERVSLEQIDVFADGVAIKRAGALHCTSLSKQRQGIWRSRTAVQSTL